MSPKRASAPRRRSREAALQVLYALDLSFRGGAPVEIQPRHSALPHLDPRAAVTGDEGGHRLGQEGLVQIGRAHV